MIVPNYFEDLSVLHKKHAPEPCLLYPYFYTEGAASGGARDIGSLFAALRDMEIPIL